jgi:2-polyprenyl-3-methyl-5-hydroxy-6-metoxy-1,4-benzoquinol methylase
LLVFENGECPFEERSKAMEKNHDPSQVVQDLEKAIASLETQRGLSILCLEPGEHLIEVAQRNLSAYPKVSFIRSRFEEWDSGSEQFDLVISAQAYH